MLTDLRDVLAELVVAPLLRWLTKGTQMDGNARPVRPADVEQQYVHLLPTAPLLTTMDDLVRDLTRAVDPGGYALHCPVAGCTWELQVPAAELEQDLDHRAGRYVIRAVGFGQEQLERAVGAHMDWHAEQTETDVHAGPDESGRCTCHGEPEPDPGAADGVAPATGVPLEQSGVNVRLAP